MLKVVVHSYFDMFTYKAIGGAAFVLSYAVLLSFFQELNWIRPLQWLTRTPRAPPVEEQFVLQVLWQKRQGFFN